MAAVTFDTHEFVLKLKKAGFDDNQAEAIIEAVGNAQDSAELATRQDIYDLRKEIEILRKDLIIKLGSIIIGAVTFIPIILKLLHLSA